MRAATSGTILALILCLASVGQARGSSTVDRVFALDTGKARLVAASTEDGLVLFDDTLEVYRIYRYKPLRSKKARARIQVVDLDGDSGPEIIGVGKPSFGLDATGNPVWDYPEGCKELAIGDLLGTPEKEVACIHGATLSALGYDGSVLWEAEIRGAKMVDLGVSMLDTDDGKEDLEFKVGKAIWRYKGDGTLLGSDFEERRATPADPWEEQAATIKALLSGEQGLDLTGDGNEETLQVEGAKVTIKASGKDEPLGVYTFPAGPVLSVTAGPMRVGDEPKTLLVFGGKGLVAFVGADGKAAREVPIDFRKARREPKVEIVGVNAVGIEDRDAVAKLFADKQAAIAKCYEKRHRSYSLTRQGKTMFKFDVTPKGKIKGSEILYTTLNDAKVNGCIRKVVSRWKLPVPKDPGAHVTADLLFTWSDRFEGAKKKK